MPTKHADHRSRAGRTGPIPPAATVVSEAEAYWLEDDLGRRVSKRYTGSRQPLVLAGRALENLGSLDGWTVARQGADGVRRILACGDELAELALSFMPVRTPAEAAVMGRLRKALRAERGDDASSHEVTDDPFDQ